MSIYPKKWPLINPRIWTLTYITVVARPASNAVTVVAANQVPAGVGIDTGLALTFIRIWKTKENVQEGKGEAHTPAITSSSSRAKRNLQCTAGWTISLFSVSLQLEHTGHANYFTITQPFIKSNLPPHTHLSWAFWSRNASAWALGWVCCVKNAANSFSMRSSPFWNPAVNSQLWRGWHGWRDTATFSQGKGRNVGEGLGGTTRTLPTSGQFWFEGCLWLTIFFKCQYAETRWWKPHYSWTCPRPQPCKQTPNVPKFTTGFRNVTMTNAEPRSLLHLALPALKHWMKRKLFLPSWHVLPVHWGGQIHLNPSTRSWQVPPWPQGFGVQSSISAMQNMESLSSTTRLAMAITDKSDK